MLIDSASKMREEDETTKEHQAAKDAEMSGGGGNAPPSNTPEYKAHEMGSQLLHQVRMKESIYKIF